MNNDAILNNDRKMTSIFERFLSLWVVLCIVAGILLGKIAPGVAQYLDGLAIYVKGAPVVSMYCATPGAIFPSRMPAMMHRITQRERKRSKTLVILRSLFKASPLFIDRSLLSIITNVEKHVKP